MNITCVCGGEISWKDITSKGDSRVINHSCGVTVEVSGPLGPIDLGEYLPDSKEYYSKLRKD